MRLYAQRYLERLCDAATANHDPGLSTSDTAKMLTGAGEEPFALGAALRYSPTRTKAVMREVLQHNLLRVEVVVGNDGRNELRMTPTHETPRWYARVLRARAIGHHTASHEPRRSARITPATRQLKEDTAQRTHARP